MPHQHTATISWRRAEPPQDFIPGKYSRNHTWTFDGGAVVHASAAPQVVRPPWADPVAVDPEEALVAAASSCHMLAFLYIASKAGFIVNAYEDHAVGTMGKTDAGAIWVSDIELRVHVEYGGERAPTPKEEDHLHHTAHEQCYIANSIKSSVVVKRV
jgi:organic hydroperoxide reductase OsmC/OhrA